MPNYCTAKDIHNRLEFRWQGFQETKTPLTLAKTLDKKWAAISQVYEQENYFLATPLFEIRLKKEQDYETIKEHLKFFCEHHSVPWLDWEDRPPIPRKTPRTEQEHKAKIDLIRWQQMGF